MRPPLRSITVKKTSKQNSENRVRSLQNSPVKPDYRFNPSLASGEGRFAATGVAGGNKFYDVPLDYGSGDHAYWHHGQLSHDSLAAARQPDAAVEIQRLPNVGRR